MSNESEFKNNFTSSTRRSKISQNVFNNQGKIPPQALELEEVVLGALMLEQNAFSATADILKPEVFYKEAHKKIYETMRHLFSNSNPIDLPSVSAELRKNGTLEIVGGTFYIAELTQKVASAANIEYHARILAQKFIQRELIRISTDITTKAYEDTTDIFDLLDYAETNLFEVAQSNLRRDIRSIQDVMRESLDKIEKAKNHEGGLTGVPTGFKELNEATGGWQKSDLIIVGARPAMGKTAFALTLARNAAVEAEIPVAVFSLEMASFQLVNRLISAESEINTGNLSKGNIGEAEWTKINKTIRRLNDAPIYIDDTPSLNVFEFRAKARRLKQQYNIQMIVIDYLQLMKGSTDGKAGGTRDQEIGSISRALKAISKELDIPVIALAQLNRTLANRQDSRPQLHDLRDSGSIEQDADMVIMLHRPEYYGYQTDESGNSTKGLAEVIIAKFRNGETRTINLKFEGEYVRFRDLQPGEANIVVPYASNLNPNSSFGQNQVESITISSSLNNDEDPSF